MTTLRIVRTGRELDADAARARLTMALDNMQLTRGQHKRLAELISTYAVAQYEAGISRGEANRFDGSVA